MGFGLFPFFHGVNLRNLRILTSFGVHLGTHPEENQKNPRPARRPIALDPKYGDRLETSTVSAAITAQRHRFRVNGRSGLSHWRDGMAKSTPWVSMGADTIREGPMIGLPFVGHDASKLGSDRTRICEHDELWSCIQFATGLNTTVLPHLLKSESHVTAFGGAKTVLGPKNHQTSQTNIQDQNLYNFPEKTHTHP